MSRIFLLLAKATVYGKTNSESIPIRPVGILVPTGVLPGGTEITEILPEIASETFTYDLNANITRLLRKAVWGLKSTPAAADDLTMAYDGNRLSSLTDNAGEVLSEALPDIPSGAYSGNDFRYDAAGCVTRDMARGITHMAYHRPGIPARMETASGDSIVFVYTAAGEKLSETVYRSGVPTKREYAGPWELVDGKIDRVNLGQGYFDSTGTFHAYIRDIAANIIGVYRAEEDADEVEQHNEFFAYGSPTGISNTLITGADKNRRKHTGKEFISELGVDSYDFSARFLAPLTGRFDSPDPKAWDYTWLSPYTFCAADPINSSDPTGMDTWMLDKSGRVLHHIRHNINDSFWIFNESDNNLSLAMIASPNGTIKNYYNLDVAATSGNINYSLYEMANNSIGFSMFTFLAKETTVEWSFLSEENAFMTTSYSKSSDFGGSDVATCLSKEGYNFTTLIHSHPGGTMAPSGLDAGNISGDVKFAQSIDKNLKAPHEYYIYNPIQKSLIGYSATSKISDYINNAIKPISETEFIKSHFNQ